MASSRNSASPDLFREGVASCLRRHLSEECSHQKLVVGFSGGRDSLALLTVLHELQPFFGFRLAACHVNHGLSSHAGEWQAFCQTYCDSLGIELTIACVDVPRAAPEGLEAAARTERYRIFMELNADWLMLGQHRGDQIETLLFNLLRGAGLQGAAGMPQTRSVRPGMRLLRPLLEFSRRDVETYLDNRSLAWIDDESNADVRFSRNFLRHRVVPLLLSRFPAIEANLAAAAERFAEAQSLLDDLARMDIADVPASFPLPLNCLEALPEPRARNLLRFMLTQHGVRIPSEARLVETLRQLLTAGADRHPTIVFGEWTISRVRKSVMLARNPAETD